MSGGYVVCQICHSYHESLTELNAHYEKDHPTKKPAKKKLPCEICERSFAGAGSLRNHMAHVHGVALARKSAGRKSNTPGRFSCSECSRKFSTKHVVVTHLVTAHGCSLEEAKSRIVQAE